VRVVVSCLAMLLMPWIVGAQELAKLPAPLLAKVTAARQACAAFENGRFQLEWGAVTRIDLDRDVHTDWVLDEAGFSCSSAASLYCGTGGCDSHFLVGQTLTSIRNRGWSVATLGQHRVLLTDVHGSLCGGINPTPCVLAHVWDPESRVWRSIAGSGEARR